ncbi:hypothetical protein BZA70DRAFT_72398 [Myxozyma melibiosi]|uniref:UBX domain-containing protein n=1 Tax=Myxozyma melibiosi TaxID=54550 RepID=A0ABR1F1F2_9ASCO
MDSLDPAHVESLQQFVTITSWPENDIEGAIQMLSVCQWNVELAITRFYDEGPLRPNPHEPARTPTPPPVVAPRIASPTPRTLAPRPSSFLASIITSVVFFPLSVVSKVAHSAYYLFTMLFPFLPRLTGVYPANLGAARSERRSVNPRDTAARFIRDFEEEVGSSGESRLSFFEGGYTQALDLAKKELRFLVVLLQSDEHDDTTKFNKEVLCAPEVVQYFQEHQILVWAGNVRESEAYQVSNALSCTKYPFLAIIAYTPATASHPSAMSIHARLQGFMSPPALIANLNTVITRHGPVLDRIRNERNEQQQAREIRAQQDSAYEASLAADRERERARAERERAEQERIAEQERVEREKLEAEQRIAQYKLWRASQLKQTMLEFTDQQPSTTEKVARISIRLPSGDRVVTRFLAESQTVEDIYAFVDCYDILHPKPSSSAASTSARSLASSGSSTSLSSMATSTAAATNSKPENYTHRYKFNLVSPMPRFLVPVDADKLIKDEKSLFPNGNLIVEEEVEEEEESVGA